MRRILILCTGNSCRSQMAEGFLKQNKKLKVFSAGTKPSVHVDPYAVEVMKEVGIDISEQKPKSINDFLSQDFDYVITVCDNAKENCPLFLGKVKHRLHIGFADPAGKPLAYFRKIRDEIKLKMKEFVDEIRA